jgi:hypothetical protein
MCSSPVIRSRALPSDESKDLTAQRIDELLRFLPLFEKPEREFVLRWDDVEGARHGTTEPATPVYPADVEEFFQLAAQPWWRDDHYLATAAPRMLTDDGIMANATLDQIKTMLTYCVRGERYRHGHWAHALESGRITALLRRLRELRPQIAATD